AGYRFTAFDTDLKERIDKQLPLPLGGDTDPDNPEYEENMKAERLYRDRQAVMTQEEFKDYDVIMNYLRGGPGFGDPLDRNPKEVEADLNDRYILKRYAEGVHGCIFNEVNGEYKVDIQATEENVNKFEKNASNRAYRQKNG